MNTYTGLAAAICCVGACYTDSGNGTLLVRDMVDRLQVALERDCDLCADKDTSIQAAANQLDLEKLQALILLQIMLVWNGSPRQRECGLRLFPLLANVAKKSHLTQITTGQCPHSILHQPQPSLPALDPHDFDWSAWIQQEARIRVFYMLYLCDVANGLYFNVSAEFEGLNIKLPLPADDAAWEANSSDEAAWALNLCGNEAVRLQNPDGSQRSTQPELGLALQALMHESYQMHPGSTNLYGKFILIHAIIAQLRNAHLADNQTTLPNDPLQLAQYDWITTENGSSLHSTTSSGTATPVGGYHGIEPQMYRSIRTALAKFKASWDMDMAIQFPPATFNTGRYGFSRDGIHFFWLANWMLEHTTADDLAVSADRRFLQVIHLVKSVKAWVISDGASRGEELGSVGDIHQQYGATDLTLDMAKLFTPLPAMVDDPSKTIKTEP